jgi:hypothetical protein
MPRCSHCRILRLAVFEYPQLLLYIPCDKLQGANQAEVCSVHEKPRVAANFNQNQFDQHFSLGYSVGNFRGCDARCN